MTEATRHPLVKICCIGSIEEARMAVRHGASALGLVSAMPSGPGVIPDESIAAIAAATPPPVATFLLTSGQDASAIVEQQRLLQATTIQVCDRVTPESRAEVRAALPGIRIVQVVHVTGPESVEEAVEASVGSDAVLLDSGNPTLAVKELGGTGRRHDWRLSRRIRETLDVPIFLAGGLRAENVAEAIHEVGPFALDVCSGVRTDGLLDESKLEAFFSAVEAAGLPGD